MTQLLGIAPVIAIDGPAGAGKSTAARDLARRLGFLLLDTGAIYRSLALQARERRVAWNDERTLADLARHLRIEFVPLPDGTQAVFVDGRDVSAPIRTPEISEGASRVSALPAVREALLDLQRLIAAEGRYVVEGRDIGTVVLPWAPVKFFLTASAEVRAQRRHEELRGRGQSSDLAATQAEIEARDQRDQSRAVAPLRAAEDAIRIDTSKMALEEVVTELERVARTRLGV